jgi:Cu2+-exporting ATPase
VCGGFWLKDALRADAAAGLAQLHAWGYRLHLLSGDDPRTVERAARELSDLSGEAHLFASVRGGVGPEDKLDIVKELGAAGLGVAMVGDGVNDAGALAAANVGIAVTGAAEVSRMSADVYLASPGISELVELFRGARRTLRTIRRGIGFSLLYNAVGITTAALGLIGPLVAAVLMPLSSLTVVTSAYKTRAFSSEKPQ